MNLAAIDCTFTIKLFIIINLSIEYEYINTDKSQIKISLNTASKLFKNSD